MSFPLKIVPSYAYLDSGPHLIHPSLSPPESINQTIPRSVQLVFHSSRQCASRSKLPLPIGRSGTLSNMWFCASTRLNIPSGISNGSASLVQITADCPYTLQCTFPQNCLSHGMIWNPSNTSFLAPSKPTTQTASRSVQPFLHSSPQNVPILYNGPPLSPSKLPLHIGVLSPRLIHGSLGPLEF